MTCQDQLVEKHQKRALNEPLLDVEVFHEDTPKYSWQGSLGSCSNGRFKLVLKATGFMPMLSMGGEAGVLVKDDEFVKLCCRTESGLVLALDRLYPSKQPCIRLPHELTVEFEPEEAIFELESGDPAPHDSAVGFINAFQDKGACCFCSRLGSASPFGKAGERWSWFVFDNAGTKFAFRRLGDVVCELGVWLPSGSTADVLAATRGFLYALSFYVGEHVGWLGFAFSVGGKRRMVLRQPTRKRTALLQRPRPDRISERLSEKSFWHRDCYVSSMFVSDEQWAVLRPVLEVPKTSRFGRPRADARAVFEAILFMLHTGIQWKYLPKTFPPKSTVHDYLSLGSRSEAFRKVFARGIGQLVQYGRINLDECFIDATFAAAKGGGLAA